MIAALICVVSLAAILQFFISYCRSILASARKMELSEGVREVAGIGNAGVSADDFERLLQLLHLCSVTGRDRTEIRAVRIYYHMLRLLGRALGALRGAESFWTEEERRNCSYFVAVALDRRISQSRDLFNHQRKNGL